MINEHYKYSELTAKIIGCAMTVHKILGNGCLEKIYQRALAIEMTLAGIAFEEEYEMFVYYKGHIVGRRRVDFLVEGVIPVELKARSFIDNGDIAQSLNHLEVCNLEVSLLFNFGEPSLNFKRFTNKKFRPDGSAH